MQASRRHVDDGCHASDKFKRNDRAIGDADEMIGQMAKSDLDVPESKTGGWNLGGEGPDIQKAVDKQPGLGLSLSRENSFLYRMMHTYDEGDKSVFNFDTSLRPMGSNPNNALKRSQLIFGSDFNGDNERTEENFFMSGLEDIAIPTTIRTNLSREVSGNNTGAQGSSYLDMISRNLEKRAPEVKCKIVSHTEQSSKQDKQDRHTKVEKSIKKDKHDDLDNHGIDQSGRHVKPSAHIDDIDHNHKEYCTVVEIAYHMIENNKLAVKHSDSVSFEDKVYLSNIVNIRNPVLLVDPTLEIGRFVQEVNKNLGEPQDKRNDDRLRWIFKRAIKFFLCHYTKYRPNKLFRREDYMPTLTKRYFPKNPEMEDDMLNSTFASKKKLMKMFSYSPLFKKDFMEFANNRIESLFHEESMKHYAEMHREVIETINKDATAYKKGFLKATNKRLDWRSSDVKHTIGQVNRLFRR
jgi:hypothetical protein